MRVWGNTIKELFENALAGVAFYLVRDIDSLVRAGKKVKQAIRVETIDIDSLLVEFLSEVLAQSDVKNVVFTAATLRELGENFLEGEIAGVRVDGFEKEIKAVSYSEVDIKKNPDTGLFETVLVFDI
jgi:SHS2 domain-containing protein